MKVFFPSREKITVANVFKVFMKVSMAGLFFVVFINLFIVNNTYKHIYKDLSDVPEAYTGIILGARVFRDGEPSNYLQDRLDSGIDLYRAGKIKRFLLSGDHGRTNYDEVNNMRKYLNKHGVPNADIFMDHAGFDTYSTMVRAKEVFQVEDAIIITQEFHLTRALYIANKKGLTACGYVADKQKYANIRFQTYREYFARIKAFFNLIFNREPKFLGKPIPITGDSKLSYD